MLSFKKISFILVVSLALGACAAKQPVPPQIVSIPVNLVNVEKKAIVVVPDEPSTKALIRINKNDPADEALGEVLDYTGNLKTYATVVTDQLMECRAEVVDLTGRLNKIKQYILLQQNQIQPVQ